MTLPKYRTSDYTIQPHPHGEYYLVKDVDLLVASHKALRKAVTVCVSALRSYQYGNSAPDLAVEIIAYCEAALAAIKETQP